ncbi:PAS domain-containing protein [Haloarchaeobius iranensis]|uniref:PAS domain S-box-containing protein n=1 Tax=Haloarchaeobius iranensis TaxID=996166 RepID=A0A1G9UH34_9EURY|nr:PAS domain-containing protein [Haloarchaeobius iranensis]SDM59237.1 PAS domain S-box-containing protein [Haloarchaeobius iranensis]
MAEDSPVSVVWVAVEDSSRPTDETVPDGVDAVLSAGAATDHAAALENPAETCFVAAGVPGLVWFRQCADVVSQPPPALLVVDDASLAEAAASGPVDEVVWQAAVANPKRFALRVGRAVEAWSEGGHPSGPELDPLVEHTRDLVAVVGRDGRLRHWNPAVETVLGKTATELDGLDVRSLVDDAHTPRLDDHLAAVAEGETRTVQLDVRTADGERQPVEFETSPIVVGGTIVGLCAIGRDVTEREARTEQLRRTERRFEAVFADPSSFLGVLDTDGRLLDVNERACEFAGIAAADATGRQFWTLPWWSHSGTERDRVRAAIDRAADGEFVRFKTTNVGAGGEIIHLDTSLRPVVRDDGTVGSIVVEGTDIGDEVKANRERELLLDAIQSAARSPDLGAALTATLRTVVGNTNAVYGEAWIPDGDELRFQDAWWTGSSALESFGRQRSGFELSRGEGLPGRVWETGAPEWVPDLEAGSEAQLPWLGEVVQFGLQSAVAVPVLGTDGSVLTVLVLLTDTSQGRDDHFLELLETITAHLGAILQRKLTEAELAAERERQQRLLETSPVGILVVDSDGSLEQENQRARDILGVDDGRTVAEAYEHEPWRVTPTAADGPTLADGWFQEVSATGTAIRNEVYVVDRADGERLWLLVNAAAVGDDEGEVIVSFSDITEQKRHEQALQNQAERVSVLNRVLRHDLRTHLTVVGGLLDRIVEQADVPAAPVEDIRRSLDDIEELSQRARHIETAFESDARNTFDLSALVDRAAADLVDTHPNAQVRVTERRSPPVLAHEHLRLVLDNLLENAVVHHDDDRPTVRVSIARHDEGTVRLVVADDGPGIPESEIELRESGFETALEHSDGLGLWIVRWLVSKSDGELRLEQTAAGSRAVVLLPVAPGAG